MPLAPFNIRLSFAQAVALRGAVESQRDQLMRSLNGKTPHERKVTLDLAKTLSQVLEVIDVQP